MSDAAPTAAEAVLNHLHDTATTAGIIDAIAATIPQAAYDVEGMDAGLWLTSMTEGGIPDVAHGLRGQLAQLGGEETDGEYWSHYCSGYRFLIFMRERVPGNDERWKQDPVEWMRERAEAARAS